jgi:hypothetical protein
LAQEAKKAGGIAEQSMIASQRAFVFAKGFSQYWEESSEPSQEGQYCWRFRPQWENSGSTPTRDLALYTNCSLRDTPLPRGFAFHAATPSEDEIGRGLIPPKSMLEGGIGPRLPEPPVTPADIIAIQNGKKYLYLWGFALYRDVFSGDKAHITRFCWGITITGNPTLYAPLSERGRPGSLLFGNLHHIEGNCADDECRT